MTADVEVDGEGTADDRDNGGVSSSIANASALMKVAQHYFLDNQDTLRSISACLKGVDVNVDVLSETMERVDNVTLQLTN